MANMVLKTLKEPDETCVLKYCNKNGLCCYETHAFKK
jgi:hypothetical protein